MNGKRELTKHLQHPGRCKAPKNAPRASGALQRAQKQRRITDATAGELQNARRRIRSDQQALPRREKPPAEAGGFSLGLSFANL